MRLHYTCTSRCRLPVVARPVPSVNNIICRTFRGLSIAGQVGRSSESETSAEDEAESFLPLWRPAPAHLHRPFPKPHNNKLTNFSPHHGLFFFFSLSHPPIIIHSSPTHSYPFIQHPIPPPFNYSSCFLSYSPHSYSSIMFLPYQTVPSLRPLFSLPSPMDRSNSSITHTHSSNAEPMTIHKTMKSKKETKAPKLPRRSLHRLFLR